MQINKRVGHSTDIQEAISYHGMFDSARSSTKSVCYALSSTGTCKKHPDAILEAVSKWDICRLSDARILRIIRAFILLMLPVGENRRKWAEARVALTSPAAQLARETLQSLLHALKTGPNILTG